MKKNQKLLVGILVFIALVATVAVVAKDKLPKTTKASLTIASCKFTSESPLEFDKDQTVSLKVLSDSSGSFTVEELGVAESLEANTAKSVSFKTSRSGVFDAKLSVCTDHTMITVRNTDGTTPATEDHTSTDADHEATEESKPTEQETTPEETTHDETTDTHEE